MDELMCVDELMSHIKCTMKYIRFVFARLLLCLLLYPTQCMSIISSYTINEEGQEQEYPS